MWKIYFFMKKNTYTPLRDKLSEKLLEEMCKLNQNSLYYIRMSTEMMMKEIEINEETTTILKKLFEYEEGLNLIEHLLGD